MLNMNKSLRLKANRGTYSGKNKKIRKGIKEK
jgi:hypothetical protein